MDAEEWDNTGLQVAAQNIKINKVLITLDLNFNVLEYARANRFNLIISHHPLIFKGIKNIIAYKHFKSKLIKELLLSKIALFILHTNLDKHFYNLLSKKLKLINIKSLSEKGIGSYGVLPRALSLKELVKKVKKELKLKFLKYTGDNNKKIKTVACVGGSGASFVDNILLEKKIDALITSDIKYHAALLSEEFGISLIDGGHYYTENIMMNELKRKLKKAFKDKIIFETNKITTDPFKFY